MCAGWTKEDSQVGYRIGEREVHPFDAAGKRSDDSWVMEQIERDWGLLSDEALRRAYDAEQSRGYSQPVAEPKEQFFNVPVQRASFPWRMVGFTAGGLIALVLVLNALSDPAVPLGPDGLLQAGSCVVVNANQLAVEVDCAEEHTGVVRVLVGFDMTCPTDTQPIRDRQGMGIACVVPS